MDRRAYLALAGGGVAGTFAGCLGDDSDDEAIDEGDDTDDSDPSEAADEADPDGYELEIVVDGLTHPWGMAFTPVDARLIVTQRDEGTLAVIDREDGSVEELDGTPEVDTSGQGGLLDVTLHPDFPIDPWAYLTYSAANVDGDTATHLGRGRLAVDELQVTEFEELFVVTPFVGSNGHYGSRVVFGEDDMVYVTSGDRQFKDFGPDHVSQDTSNEIGTTLRLKPDGSIPEDNPFVGDPDASDAIYSYGHRNAQGMTVHPETGEIWQSEHGERDGDEINIIERGGNHGWPIAHYGCEYGSDESVGDPPHEREDTVDPVYHWECGSGGFPPAGATFYDANAFPNWRGDLFIGNLAGRYLGRFSVDGRDVEEVEPLLEGEGWRIRDVAVAPDTEHLYVAVDDDDAPIVRLTLA